MTDEELPDEKTITLRKPIKLGEQAWTELNLREPTGDELVQIDKLEGRAADIFAISLISGVPKAAVGQIGARDLLAAARYLGAFLGDGPQTGEKR